MPEYDYISLGEVDDPVLGVVKYSITQTINVICPRCGNPDCAEIEEFKERLKRTLGLASTTKAER